MSETVNPYDLSAVRKGAPSSKRSCPECAQKDREIAAMVEDRIRVVGELKRAVSAQDERERKAGERCGVPYEAHGCDWPEWVADKIVEQAALLERARKALETLSLHGLYGDPNHCRAILVERLMNVRSVADEALAELTK